MILSLGYVQFVLILHLMEFILVYILVIHYKQIVFKD